jgi:hypothetical protein
MLAGSDRKSGQDCVAMVSMQINGTFPIGVVVITAFRAFRALSQKLMLGMYWPVIELLSVPLMLALNLLQE